MDYLTPYFPALRARCAPLGQVLARASRRADSLAGLAALFGGFFPACSCRPKPERAAASASCPGSRCSGLSLPKYSFAEPGAAGP